MTFVAIAAIFLRLLHSYHSLLFVMPWNGFVCWLIPLLGRHNAILCVVIVQAIFIRCALLSGRNVVQTNCY